MYFEATSTDASNSFRTEGYGYIRIPPEPGARPVSSLPWAGRCTASDSSSAPLRVRPSGFYARHVDLWRPSGSLRQNLSSFFVGGAPELLDITHTGVPLSHRIVSPLRWCMSAGPGRMADR